MNQAIFDHFTQQAQHYDKICKKGFLGYIRRREQNAMSHLLRGYMNVKDVIDLGAGVGMYSRLALSLGAKHVTAIDQVPAMIDQINDNKITAIVSDASTYSHPTKVDVVIMAGVLEFVPDPIGFLQNARQLVNSGALAAILAPPATLPIKLYKHYHQSHGVLTNSFSRSELFVMAAKSGWQVEETTMLWPFTLLARLRAI